MSTTVIRRKELFMFARYAITGVMNTVLTLLIIFVTKTFAGINPWIANALGYGAGFVNSFIWNKKWVFKSKGEVKGEVLKFCVGFCLCYLLQFAATWMLTTQTPLREQIFRFGDFALSGYGIATLAGMVVYTVANFIFNKAITFRT